MLPDESAAEQTIDGLALQLMGLDFQEPMAFEQAREIAREIETAATQAIEARGEVEFEARVDCAHPTTFNPLAVLDQALQTVRPA